MSQVPQRIVIVGCCGAGKSTLAEALCRTTGYARIELDKLYWQPHWVGSPTEEFRARVAEAVAQPRWVLDGNYSSVRDLTWKNADAVLWLDYDFGLVMWRLLRRTIERSASQQLLWGTNRESWRKSFTSRDSILWWGATHWHQYRQRYQDLLYKPDTAHLRLVRERRPRSSCEIMKRLGVLV